MKAQRTLQQKLREREGGRIKNRGGDWEMLRWSMQQCVWHTFSSISFCVFVLISPLFEMRCSSLRASRQERNKRHRKTKTKTGSAVKTLKSQKGWQHQEKGKWNKVRGGKKRREERRRQPFLFSYRSIQSHPVMEQTKQSEEWRVASKEAAKWILPYCTALYRISPSYPPSAFSHVSPWRTQELLKESTGLFHRPVCYWSPLLSSEFSFSVINDSHE